ncbi:MAG: hypothetical protein M5R40_18085 [Anaerolineae bacterium]|nr:hypothetical protein [Anaerolineae bacterium]
MAAAWIASPLLPEQYASLAVVAPFAVILALAMAVKPEIALWVTVFTSRLSPTSSGPWTCRSRFPSSRYWA